MNKGAGSSFKRIGKALVALLLALQATGWLMNNPSMNAYSDGSVNYAGLRSVEDVRAAAEKNMEIARKAAIDALIAVSEPAPDVAPANVEDHELSSIDATQPRQQATAVDDAEAGRLEAPMADDRARMADEADDRESDDSRDSPDAPLMVSLADRHLDTSTLDDIRGGFDIEGTNLQYSIGIERAVYINGELVAHNTLNLKDMQVMSGGGAVPQLPVGTAANTVSTIQNGGGNTFTTTQINPNLTGTVIQNTLNDQKIQNVTTINAAVNSAQLLRSMSVQNAVQNGIVNSLRR